MTQIFFPSVPEKTETKLCCYTNRTNQLAIIHIKNVPNHYCERVVFPGENFLFEAPLDTQVEIHRYTKTTGIVVDKIECAQLQVHSSPEDNNL